MKKIFNRIVVLLVLAMAVSFTASAQISVTIRPTHPVIVRTVAPSRAHVWVDEDWAWRDGKYVATGGYWAAPPYPAARWVPGHWARRRGGWYWIPGHWRGRR